MTVQISSEEVDLRWYKSFKEKLVSKYSILIEKIDLILDIIIKEYRFPLYLDELSPKFAKKYLSLYKYQNPDTEEYFIKDRINKAERQIKNGKVTSHSEVKKKYLK